MDAHFGILPPVSEECDSNHLTVDEQRLVESIARTLGLAEYLPPPSVVAEPIAATDFRTANNVGDHAPLGWPGLPGGFQGESMGLGFPGVPVQNTAIPPTTLPILSPSSSVDSQSPLTPPEAWGGQAAYLNPGALTDIPRDNGIGHPAPHIQSTPLPSTARGNAFLYRFGEDSSILREFGFQIQIPRDHPNYDRPSHPRPSGGFHFFGGPAAEQYTPRTQEFVQGSSSSAVHQNPSDLLPVAGAPQLAAMPFHQLAPHGVGPSLPQNYALYPPSACADDSRHLSAFNALGALPSPSSHTMLQANAVAGPSSPTSTLGKRRAEPLSNPGPSKARKTTASTLSQQALPEPGKENAPAAPDVDSDFEPQYKHTTKIDWANPPKWGEDAIPSDMAPKDLFPYLSKTYGNDWKASAFRCRYGECTRVCGSLSSLRSHVTGKAHMDLRSECLRCGWDVRTDNFSSRHTKKNCDKKYEKKMNPGKRQRTRKQ